MAVSKIKGVVSNTVTLGQDGYAPRLIITAGGAVLPATYGADAIVDPASVRHGMVTNHGTVAGAYGGRGAGVNGGVGVDFISAGTLKNTGTIDGGRGGYRAATYNGYHGGIGVELAAGGSIVNAGRINGGEGGPGYYATGSGGTGVMLTGGALTNSGAITGGASQYPGLDDVPGVAGHGGAGVYASAGASITNSGAITGGASAGQYEPAPQGGLGVLLNGASLTNTGTITGGVAGYSYNFSGTGGAGVAMYGQASLSNAGQITGGQGGYGGGEGGAGVYLRGGTLTNTGTITGGMGGGYTNGTPSLGGDGVDVTGGVLLAGGTIIGGYQYDGVDISGGNVIASGTISAGGSTAYAVGLSGTGTLTIDPGAVFNGDVGAFSRNAGNLVLGGTAPGTLTGLGTEFVNIGTIQVASAADWTVTGGNTLAVGSGIQDGGTLSIAGTLTDGGAVTVASAGNLNTGSSGAIQLGTLVLAGGHVDVTSGGTLAVGASLSGGAGTLTVETGVTVSGAGTISADSLSVGGALVAQGGTLVLHAATSGSGTATIDAGATLLANGTLSVAQVAFASGGDTLALAKPTELTSTLSGFGAGDVVDLQKLIATTLSYSGGTLTLLDGTTPVDTLHFAGSYSAGDFALSSDSHGGTDLLYAGANFAQAGDMAPGGDAAYWHDAAVGGVWHDGGDAPWIVQLYHI